MAILFLDFFGSDPSKMDQTRKFGEETSRILEFKPKELDFQLIIKLPYPFHGVQLPGFQTFRSPLWPFGLVCRPIVVWLAPPFLQGSTLQLELKVYLPQMLLEQLHFAKLAGLVQLAHFGEMQCCNQIYCLKKMFILN